MLAAALRSTEQGGFPGWASGPGREEAPSRWKPAQSSEHSFVPPLTVCLSGGSVFNGEGYLSLAALLLSQPAAIHM